MPTPGRSATTITFDLPEVAEVVLEVFDVRGRLVRRLVDHAMGAGRYKVPWEGNDSTGNRVSPGVYFYRLEAGSLVATHKLTIAG